MNILNSLCAVQWTNYIVDIAAIIFCLVMMIVSGKRGFISCFFGIISTVAALLAAIFLGKVIVSATGGLFGLQDYLYKTFEGAFAKLQGFNVDISDTGVEAALKTQEVSAIVGRLVLNAVGKGESLAAGTTLAMLLATSTSELATLLICGIALYIIVKVAALLLKGLFNTIADNSDFVGGVNSLFGALFGVLYAVLIVSVVLAVLAVIPNETITAYFAKTLFIGKIYEHNPLIYLLSLFI